MNKSLVFITIISLFLFSILTPDNSEAYCLSGCGSQSLSSNPSLIDAFGGITIAQAVLDTTETEEEKKEGTGTEVDTLDDQDSDYDSILLEAAKYANKENGAASTAKEWTVFVSVYLWLSGLNGDIGIGNTRTDIDASFGDIWENFDVGAQLHMEFWWKRWLFYIDPSYVKLSNNRSQTTESGPARAKSKVKQFIFEFAGGYRVAEIPLSSSPKSHNGDIWPELNIDIYGGGRIYSIDSKVKLKLDTPDGPVKDTLTRDKSWFDFIVGTRLLFNLTESLILSAKTDIGGFGLGFSSDISWNFVANVGYELPWMGITPYIGYRVLYVDYRDGTGTNRFIYDVWQTGPQIGLGFQF